MCFTRIFYARGVSQHHISRVFGAERLTYRVTNTRLGALERSSPPSVDNSIVKLTTERRDRLSLLVAPSVLAWDSVLEARVRVRKRRSSQNLDHP